MPPRKRRGGAKPAASKRGRSTSTSVGPAPATAPASSLESIDLVGDDSPVFDYTYDASASHAAPGNSETQPPPLTLKLTALDHFRSLSEVNDSQSDTQSVVVDSQSTTMTAADSAQENELVVAHSRPDFPYSRASETAESSAAATPRARGPDTAADSQSSCASASDASKRPTAFNPPIPIISADESENGITAMVIDGKVEYFDRHGHPTAKPARAITHANSHSHSHSTTNRISAKKRGPVQLTIASGRSLSLAHPSTRGIALIDESDTAGDRAAKSTIPSMFQPRNREIQQRISALSVPSVHTSTSSGTNSGSKRKSTGTSGSATKRTASYVNCPRCGSSQPESYIPWHIEECVQSVDSIVSVKKPKSAVRTTVSPPADSAAVTANNDSDMIFESQPSSHSWTAPLPSSSASPSPPPTAASPVAAIPIDGLPVMSPLDRLSPAHPSHRASAATTTMAPSQPLALSQASSISSVSLGHRLNYSETILTSTPTRLVTADGPVAANDAIVTAPVIFPVVTNEAPKTDAVNSSMHLGAGDAVMLTVADPPLSLPVPEMFLGPKSAASFESKRKTRTDGIQADTIAHFHLTHQSSANNDDIATSITPRYQLEWHLLDPTRSSFGPSPGTAIVLHHHRVVDSNAVIDIHFTCDPAVYTTSPIIDFTAPELAVNRPSLKRFEFSPSHLKSLLQKNMRQTRAQASVRASMALIVRAGFVDFLRRIAVIMIEDAVLHPMLPLVVWLTGVCAKRKEGFVGTNTKAVGATNGHRWQTKDGAVENRSMQHPPTVAMVNACLALVYDIAAVGVRDRPPTIQNPAIGFLSAEFQLLSQPQLTCVLALLMRGSLGGLPFDVALMKSMAWHWLKRFTIENTVSASSGSDRGNQPPPPHRQWLPFLTQLFRRYVSRHPVSLIDVFAVLPIQNEDVLLSAIDHHCSPIIDWMKADQSVVQPILLAYVNAEEARTGQHVDRVKLLQSMLWKFRSAVTNKQPLFPAKTPTAHTNTGTKTDTNDDSAAPEAYGRGGGGGGDDGGDTKDPLYSLFTRLRPAIDTMASRIIAQRRVSPGAR